MVSASAPPAEPASELSAVLVATTNLASTNLASRRRRQEGADGLSGGGGDQEARDDGMRVVLSLGDMDRLTSRSHLRDGARGEKGGQDLPAEIPRDTWRRDTAVTREEAAKADRVQNEALVAAVAARAKSPPGKCFLFLTLSSSLPPRPLI